MKRDFLAKIREGIFLFDGGLGTELQGKGLPVGEKPESWNWQHPEIVEQIHRSYAQAGAQAVTSNSFGASPHKLKGSGHEQKTREVNKVAAELVRRGVGDDVFVAGSVGPTGAILMMGEIGEAEVLSGYETQISGLADGGADLIIIETMSDIEEAKLAIKAAKNVCKLPIVATMSFEPGARGFRTIMGIDILTAASELEVAGSDVIGTNCGIGIDRAIEIIAEMRRYTGLPLIVQPNAGLPKLVNGKTVYEETPEMMAEKVPLLIDAGASIVGGCCGTTPQHIAAFRKVIEALN